MKKNLVWLILILHLFGMSRLHAQQDCITNTYFIGCSNNTTGNCPTFYHDPCSGWTRSHGAPFISPNSDGTDGIIFASFDNGSDGIYTPFQFVQGNNYDVVVYYQLQGFTVDGVVTGANGSFSVYAASSVTEQTRNGCQESPPTSPATEALYTKVANNQNYDYSSTGDLQTLNQISAPFSQVWTYPTSTTDGTIAVLLSEIYVCPSCYAVTSYSSGTLPVQVNGQDITISIPAQPVPTLVEVTNAIYLKPGFNASSANNATFVAEISPFCAYSNYMAARVNRNRDSSVLNNFSIGAVLPSREADSTAGGLRVYPTVSKGAVTITGSPASLSNAEIVVLSESGQLLLQRYNAAATTLQLDLSNIVNGIYFIQIRQQAKVTTKKVVIIH